MNIPTHIVCGAFLAQTLVRICSFDRMGRARPFVLAAGAMALGMLSHILLDFLPHYAWIVYLDWFRPLPYHWLIREAVLGFAVAIPSLMVAGKAWPFVAAGMLGAGYPDLEKVLVFDLHLPDAYILFGWHSSHLSSRTGGFPIPILIGFECLILGGFIFALVMSNRGLRPHTR